MLPHGQALASVPSMMERRDPANRVKSTRLLIAEANPIPAWLLKGSLPSTAALPTSLPREVLA